LMMASLLTRWMILAAIAATAGAFVVPAGQNRLVALAGRGVSPLKSTWNIAEQRLMRRAGGKMA
jgi:hypothetical protein